MDERKIVVIRDSIPLPHLGWGYSFMGPVMHPTRFDNNILRKSLSGNPPAKFIEALNPDNYDQKVLLTLDNYLSTNDELFNPQTGDTEELDIYPEYVIKCPKGESGVPGPIGEEGAPGIIDEKIINESIFNTVSAVKEPTEDVKIDTKETNDLIEPAIEIKNEEPVVETLACLSDPVDPEKIELSEIVDEEKTPVEELVVKTEEIPTIVDTPPVMKTDETSTTTLVPETTPTQANTVSNKPTQFQSQKFGGNNNHHNRSGNGRH